jgi:large subunit ribosomal protein L22
MLRGKAVNEVLEVLDFCPRKAAGMIRKVVRSAIANAEESTGANVDVNRLFVSTAYVDVGPPYPGKYRQTPGYRGRPYLVKPPTSHITVVLQEMSEEEWKTKKGSARRKQKTKASSKRSSDVPSGDADQPPEKKT